MKHPNGYTFIILLLMMTLLAIGLLVAVPVWQTQLQREAEEELIFRGGQYVEAVRRFQLKNPGAFPKNVEELIKGRFLRRPFRDPMTADGRWDFILQPGAAAPIRNAATAAGTPAAASQVLVVPQGSLSSVDNPRLIGVVSRSPRTGFRLYHDNETYDTWLFFYGQNAESNPEIIRLGRPEK
jgi:type II secretory pathway pseudopilin PulG